MAIPYEQKRLNAIKLKYQLFSTRCDSCLMFFKRQKMWTLYRYGVNGSYQKWHYCQNCFQSAEDVLNEVDTDECQWGIAGVDDFHNYEKKDKTRIEAYKKAHFEETV